MKRKIGTIYNKPIIEGDINLKTPNEIHKSELGGENNSLKFRYFAVQYYNADHPLGTNVNNLSRKLCIFGHYEGYSGGIRFNANFSNISRYGSYIYAFKTLDVAFEADVDSLDETINEIIASYQRDDPNNSVFYNNCLIEISKEEYDNFDMFKYQDDI